MYYKTTKEKQMIKYKNFVNEKADVYDVKWFESEIKDLKAQIKDIKIKLSYESSKKNKSINDFTAQDLYHILNNSEERLVQLKQELDTKKMRVKERLKASR